ncbi:MAG: hypothetical protein JWQ18_467, partial [Conexibacter sp.]|nr:hypothetical protein [Conexibacter sp.]
ARRLPGGLRGPVLEDGRRVPPAAVAQRALAARGEG